LLARARIRGGSLSELEEAVEYLRQAIELEPNHALAPLWLSGLMRVNRSSWNERLEPARRARELEPLWARPHLFFVQLIDSMPALQKEKWAIIRQLKSYLQNPDQLRQVRWREIWTLESEGRLAEAVQAGETFISSGGDDINFPMISTIMGIYMLALYEIGAYDEVRKWPQYQQALHEVHFPGGVGAGQPSYEEQCISPDESRLAITYVKCSYEELLRGNIRVAQNILEENLPVGLLDFRSYKSWYQRSLNHPRSPVITLATIHKLNGRDGPGPGLRRNRAGDPGFRVRERRHRIPHFFLDKGTAPRPVG